MSLALRKAGIKDTEREKVSRFVEVKDFGPSMTSQAPAEDVDINKIVARIQKGQTVLASNGEPFYGDVSDITGLQDALIKVQEANDLFMQYPAELREKFDNDPVKMVEFLENPENLDKAIEMGLANPKPVVTPPPPGAGAAPGGAPHS